jgi:hypothetical protein
MMDCYGQERRNSWSTRNLSRRRYWLTTRWEPSLLARGPLTRLSARRYFHHGLLAPVLLPGDKVLLEEVRIDFKAQPRSRRDF